VRHRFAQHGERLGDAVEALGGQCGERVAHAGDGIVWPDSCHCARIEAPAARQIDARARVAVVVEVDEPSDGHVAFDRLGRAIEAAGRQRRHAGMMPGPRLLNATAAWQNALDASRAAGGAGRARRDPARAGVARQRPGTVDAVDAPPR
jgi:hypothetical protein